MIFLLKKKQYALYKGDKYLFGGTKEELANYLKVKPNTIRYYSSNAYKKRIKDNSYLVIEVECDY